MTAPEGSFEEPIPISLVAGRYLLFSVDAVTYLRREHHICGVLIGTIPLVPQQNVFLGLPLELMPEEVQLLVEKKVAYVVDDAIAHQQALATISVEKRVRYLKELQIKARDAADLRSALKEHSRAQALSKVPSPTRREVLNSSSLASTSQAIPEESLFATPSLPSRPISTLHITPATSASILTLPPRPLPSLHINKLPAVPESYPLFRHLHSKGYFTSPGLRFGCQYMVYPGDPLRFHSHFLASHVGWDDDLDLMDLVGGGRLGTVVKKGYLIGGQETGREGAQSTGDDGSENIRTFSIEWAAM